MKTRRFFYPFLFAALLATFFVATAFAPNDRITEERDLDPFDEIGLAISADLYLTQGAQQPVKIEASEEVLANIETKISGGHLEIKFKESMRNPGDIKIWITIPEIEELNIAGSGSIFATSGIETEELELNIAGSGNMELSKVICDEIEANIAGSGNLKMDNSTAEEAEISLAGSGDAQINGLKVAEASVSIAGSGDCIIHVTDELDVSIVGSGDVKYEGDPRIEVSTIGSGKVKKI